MKVLFVHQNFPGQFVYVAQALSKIPGNRILAVTHEGNTRPELIPTHRYAYERAPSDRRNPLAASFADRAARGARVASVLQKLQADGFNPDIVIGHIGWGETLYVKDVWPDTKLIVHAEFYYAPRNGDHDFDPEFATTSLRQQIMVKSRNAAILLAMADADYGVAPSRWQGSRFPRELQAKLAILHEGIETDRLITNPGARFLQPAAKLSLSARDEVITFVNRNLEPYRGYHIFMRALPKILQARPNARVVIVGGDGVSYGPRPGRGKSWKQLLLDEVKSQLDLSRVHFVGTIPYTDFIALMQISSAHVYLTYPFVLSWSLLEAMSAGALVIASRTAPVQEVITSGVNGLLFNFFDHCELADKVVAALADPKRYAAVRRAARQSIVQGYDLQTQCLPKWLRFVEAVVGPT